MFQLGTWCWSRPLSWEFDKVLGNGGLTDVELFSLPGTWERGKLVFWEGPGDRPPREEAHYPQQEHKPLSLRSESAACN